MTGTPVTGDISQEIRINRRELGLAVPPNLFIYVGVAMFGDVCDVVMCVIIMVPCDCDNHGDMCGLHSQVRRGMESLVRKARQTIKLDALNPETLFQDGNSKCVTWLGHVVALHPPTPSQNNGQHRG